MNTITEAELENMLTRDKKLNGQPPIIIFPKHAHRDEISQLKMFLEDEQWDAYEVVKEGE